MNIESIISTLVFFLISGIAVKQISYILLHGSIFEKLRFFIRKQARNSRFGFPKLNELFTCAVCMNTQVSIWLITIPIFFSGVIPLEILDNFLLTFLIIIMTIFSVSGVAVLFWNISEHRAEEFKKQTKAFEAELNILRLRLIDKGDDPKEIIAKSDNFSRQKLNSILKFISDDCDHIGCGYAKRDCRVKAMRTLTEKIRKEDPTLSEVLPIVVPRFFKRSKYIFDDAEREELLRKTHIEILSLLG